MRILLVDDDPIILEDIKNSLHWDKLGIDAVETAGDTAQARAALLRTPADIVVCDIEMPKETGLDLLRWFREQGMDGKFLLLTSFGKFEYAAEAVRLNASEYLMKPFHVEAMELALQKAVQERKKELFSSQASDLGSWMYNNPREIRLSIWNKLIHGSLGSSERLLLEKLRGTGIEINTDEAYRLVLIQVTNLEEDRDTFGYDLLTFMLTNIASEVFSGSPENDSVLCYSRASSIILAIVCPDKTDEELTERCMELRTQLSRVLSSTATFCLLNPCSTDSFQLSYIRGVHLLERSASYYGSIFSESMANAMPEDSAPVMDMNRMRGFLSEGNKKDFMAYIKTALDLRVKSGRLDARMLKNIHRELQQAIYSHLAERGIQVSLLLNDRLSEQFTAKAEQSALDLIRCENYVLDKVFSYEQEVEHSRGLIEQVNEYIHAHYAENIGRNEIGAAFFLVPEYMARLYKKKTGVALKDYINNYRLEQARRLLLTSERSVSDIALSVGFDNLSYFSTLFKKSSGMTPLEYRRSISETD